MASTFFGMDIANSALSAAQVLMDVAGQNIANDATQGYSQQVAELAPTQPYAQPDMGGLYTPQLGTGVQVQEVQRVRAGYLDGLFRSTQSGESYYGTRSNYLTAIQSALDEPGSSGLSTAMNTFLSDFQTLSQDPQSTASRTVVQQDGEALAAQVQGIYKGLESVGQQAQSQASLDAQTVNTDLKQLGNLNQTIATAQALGQQPNDLLDERDNLLDSLSQLTNFSFTQNTTEVGSYDVTQVTVTMPAQGGGTVTLLDGGKYGSLSVQPTATSASSYASESAGLNLNAEEDTINGAAIDITSSDSLDSIAQKINDADAGVAATVVQNGSQYQLQLSSTTGQAIGGSGDDLFGTSAQGLGISLTSPQLAVSAQDADTGATSAVAPTGGSIGAAYAFVNQDLNPNYQGSLMSQLNGAVAALANAVNEQQEAGYYQDPTSGDWESGVPFFATSDGSSTITAANIALSSQVQGNTAYIAAAGTSGDVGDGSNATAIADIANESHGPLQQYSSFVSDMGSQVDLSQNLQGTAQSLLTQVTSQRSSTAGVSINDQMTNLMQAQTMYTAAAKVSEAMDSSLQSLISAIQP